MNPTDLGLRRQYGKYAPEFAMLLAAARTAPDGAWINALAGAGVDWLAVYREATRQGVRLLVYRSLRAVCWNRIPVEVRREWEQAHQSLLGKNLFLTGELLRLTEAFAVAETHVAVMKGPVIAEMAYGDFGLREFSDLDLLVNETDFSKAVEIIERLGYARFWPQDSRRMLRFLRHVGEYKLTSDALQTEIDLHWRVATRATALCPSVRDFPSGFQPVYMAGSTVLSFAPQDLPLYLAAQGGWDEWNSLRRICDVAEFLRRYPEVDWTPHLETARRLGGERSMLTGLALAEELLGADLPDSISERIAADAVVQRLTARAIRKLQDDSGSDEAVSRYLFQLRAKTGLIGKIALARSIFMDRTAEDGSWMMLPRHLWWIYPLLRPLRICGKLLRLK